jgi:hypothetical protein
MFEALEENKDNITPKSSSQISQVSAIDFSQILQPSQLSPFSFSSLNREAVLPRISGVSLSSINPSQQASSRKFNFGSSSSLFSVGTIQIEERGRIEKSAFTG